MLLDTNLIIMLSAGVFGAGLAAFILGRVTGGYGEKNRHAEEIITLEKKVLLAESSKNDLLREIETLKRVNEKYLHFVIRIPETVKKLNSLLTFDETVSSIIRFTKDMIDTDCIELYIYDEQAKQLELEAAFGSNRKSKITVPLGEGVIGRAAETEFITTLEGLQSGASRGNDRIFLGAPITFKSKLIGVLGIGRIKDYSGDIKRLIAMVADLAGVALQNCESLTTAQKQANTDPLTGLNNRKFFAEKSMEEAQKALSYNFPISIFMFDIDHFKKYNDNNGHAEGDYLLKELSRLLRENTRGSDVLARYGGEEFIALLPNTNKEGAFLYGEKIRGVIESAPFRNREKQPLGFVSISGGVATFPEDAETIEGTIKLADAALYNAKETSRNRVMKYEHFGLSQRHF